VNAISEMMLKKDYLVFVKINARAYEDERYRVDKYIVAYRGIADGAEYRKAFQVPHGASAPVMPETGTHAELNGMMDQYRNLVMAD
jgi:hypothetical protein